MAHYQILYWQDIPSQVKAWDDIDEVRIELSQKFAARIDLAAQKQGLTHTDDYLAHWMWGDEQERDGSPEEVAATIKNELESR